MIDLLERAAAASPENRAVVTPEGEATYRELLDDARRIAADLLRRRVGRLAVVEPDAGWVIRLLAAAALAGAEPCQYQADISLSEFAAQSSALGHEVVVTRRTELAASGEVVEPVQLLARTALDDPLDTDRPQPLLIRTTGTTGTPKAARHDWRVLGRTVERVQPAPSQRWLLAYGPHQFAGIQVLLHVIAARAQLVAPFPRNPRDGLDAMLAHQVTCASATPTYWRFLLAEARSSKVKLPSLEQITLGGEASSGDLLEELRHRFPTARISQVYASTEFGSISSIRDGQPGIAVQALYSEENPTANIRVQDGELWVRPESGMLGYAGDDIHVQAAGNIDGWQPTGDLVEIVDGRVNFRGRNSEVINVGGIKVNPLPVEERIAALEGVAVARVFGRPNRLTGAIVAAQVVPVGGTAAFDEERLRHDIADAVADLPRAWQPRSITFVEKVETKGFKTVRAEPS